MSARARGLVAGALLTVAPAVGASPLPGQWADSSVVLREVSVDGAKHAGRSLWDRPVAATSIGQAQVRRFDIVAMKDVSAMAPNFYIPAYGSRMTSTIYVRGLGARIDQPVVGLTVDNVPILNKDAYDTDIADLAAISVVRGPQGALEGRNAMCGMVRMTTLGALDWQGTRVRLTYGRGGDLQASAGAYRRLSSTVAASLTAQYGRNDGFWHNAHRGGQRVGAERHGGTRLKTHWRPAGSSLKVDNVLAVGLARQDGYPYAPVQTGVIAYDDTCSYRRTTVTDGLTASWRMGTAEVTSVTAFQYLNDDMRLDQDFTQESYFTLRQRRHEWALTEDLVARGAGWEGRWQWMGGVFGFWRRTSMDAPVTFMEDGIANLITGHRNDINPGYPVRWDDETFRLGSDFTVPTRGVSLYTGHVLRVAPRLEVSAALRLDMERSTLDYHNACRTGFQTLQRQPDGSLAPWTHTAVDLDLRGTMHRSFTQVLPSLTASWLLPRDSRLYVSVAKGYKAGGFNTQMFSDVLQQRVMALMGLPELYDVEDIVGYDPEKSWDMEVGAHVSIPGAWNARVHAAAFWIICQDQQLTVFPPGTVTGRMMTNAGRTNSRGVELTATASPAVGAGTLDLQGAWGFTHATFARYNDGHDDLSGKRLPYAPANTLFGAATWTVPVAALRGSLSVGANVRAVGDIWWDDANTVRQPMYATLGALASYASHSGGWAVQLWGENLTGARYDTFYFRSVGRDFLQRGTPWRIGATLRLNIGL